MSTRRMLRVAATGLMCGAIAVGSSFGLAHAQGLKAPDDPFGDIDLESLKRNGKRDATGHGAPAEVAPEPEQPGPQSDAEVQREVQQLFSNENGYVVQNRPRRTTVFMLNAPTRVVTIGTYHWNNGRGTRAPGTIALRSGSGEIFGPWQASGAPGQGGTPNAYWSVRPDIGLPAGTYTVIDSDPATWANNAASRNAGMAAVAGYAE